MARRGGKQDPEMENPFDVKMVPYEQALAELKEAIERNFKGLTRRKSTADNVEKPRVYRVVPRGEV